jgi:hypothetical protein
MLFRAAAAAFAAIAAAGLLLAPAAQASSRSVQVSGNQLKSALLPASDFGSGFQSQATVGSGSSLLHRPARGHISSMSCGSFEGTVGVGTFGETAFAVRFISPPNLSPDRYYFLSVVQFASTKAAASYYSQAYAKYAKCTDFTETAPPNSGLGGGSGKFTLHSISKTSIGAYQAFRVGQSADFSKSPGFSLLANTLVVVAGTDIFYIVSTGLTNDLVPASLIRDQISRVQRLR